MPCAPVSPEIIEAIGRGWTIVTGNQRAARGLRYGFNRRQVEAGVAVWEPPKIFAWETWLGDMWHRLVVRGSESAMLLNSSQESSLWRAVIESDREQEGTLRSLDSLAELARAAWKLLWGYRGRRRLAGAADTADTRVFARWAAEFERRCGRGGYLTQAQLEEVLSRAVEARKVVPPEGILLVGFDAMTPAQTALLETMRHHNDNIAHQQGHQSSPERRLRCTTDSSGELNEAAEWLRDYVTEHPGDTVAVIVPGLEAERAGIERVFRRVLAPELLVASAEPGSGPFEFSLGVPLARTAMVEAALDLLRWTTGPLALDRITALLLSPYVAPTGDYLARAEFDGFVLRRLHLLQPELTLEAVYRLALDSAGELQVLLKHMQMVRELLPVSTQDRGYADWAATMRDLLAAAGWGAGARESSVEFQMRRKWESALDELATLDFEGARVSFATALAGIERIVSETLFAPESRHAPVQIMGPLEAAGSSFDAIWFLRAADLTWPVPPSPNPLLPWLLQRDLGMPGADLARDASLARRITARIADSAPVAIFSYAEQTADGQQRVSPALVGLTLAVMEAVPVRGGAAPVELEAWMDDGAVPPPPDRVLAGGAVILAAQAACGFRAFAEHRLMSSGIEAPTLGLDPRERGTLVHKVLERFWTQVRSHAALVAMRVDERDSVLGGCIDQTLARTAAGAVQPWPRAYVATERQRLMNLLRPWLEFERERTPFEVLASEQELPDVKIGPLRLKVRVDRIDTMSDGETDGGMVILDYKTGPATPADWLGEQPDAPQLPLYAVVAEHERLAGIAFAHVRAGKDLGLAGYESRAGVLPKATKMEVATLSDQVEQWRGVLNVLAEDFYAGEARVAPKQFPATCKRCGQRLLCRVSAETLAAVGIEELEQEDGAMSGELGDV